MGCLISNESQVSFHINRLLNISLNEETACKCVPSKNQRRNRRGKVNSTYPSMKEPHASVYQARIKEEIGEEKSIQQI